MLKSALDAIDSRIVAELQADARVSTMLLPTSRTIGRLRSLPTRKPWYDVDQEPSMQTVASKVLAAIALENVTGRKPDPARFNELQH
jgi:hypothetical protein